MTGKRPSADELLSRAVSALQQAPAPAEAMAEALARTRNALPQAAEHPTRPGRATRVWRTIMRHKKLTLSAAAATLIAVGLATLFVIETVKPSVAFGEAMENMSRVKTLRAKVFRHGQEAEVWAKRPNRVRMEMADGKYWISNGPTLWRVHPKANRAVREPSWYYEQARRRGMDLLDLVLSLYLEEEFSGFFSEKPVARETRDGKTYDVYRMEAPRGDDRIHFEGRVDVRTDLLQSLKIERTRGNKRETYFALTILAADEPMPDEKFVFTRAEGMTVKVVKPATQPAPATAPAGGATLSGRITWAASGKPVPDARVRVSGPVVRGKSRYVARITTGADGVWKATGVPPGKVSIDVRSWNLKWPAVPTFKGNLGPAWRPEVVSDGKSARAGLDFKVYHPEQYCARVAVKVTDEDGKPVAGAICSLYGPRWTQQQSILGPRGIQYTDADGRIVSDLIWPTDQPVRLLTSHKDSPGPYAAWAVPSEPFTITSTASYDLNVVLPFARKVKLTVVDRSGKPVQGLSVKAFAGPEGWMSLLLPRPGKKVKTGVDGTVLLDRLAPNAPANVILLRLDPDIKNGLPPLASAVVAVTGPKEKVPGERKVTFDDRPICIEGTFASPRVRPDDRFAYVFASSAGDRHTWRSKIANGAFVLQGLPAGQVRLRYRYLALPPAGRGFVEVECRDTLRLEPGHTYTVKITGDRVHLISTKP